MASEGSRTVPDFSEVLAGIDLLVRVDYERNLSPRAYAEQRWETIWPQATPQTRARARAKAVTELSMMWDESVAEAEADRAAMAEAQWRGTS